MRHSHITLLTEEDKKLPFYLVGIGTQENQEHVIRPYGLNYYQFIYTTKGGGDLYVDNKHIEIKSNMGFFLGTFITHEYSAINEPWETNWIVFGGYAAAEFMNIIGFSDWEVFYTSSISALEDTMQNIYQIAKSPNSFKSLECSHLIYKFLLELKNYINNGSENLGTQKYLQLQPLINYLENNFFKNITLEDMALVLGITPQHLCRLFKSTYNMRPFEYLSMLKIRKAKELLLSSPNVTVKQVALETGYSSTSYFCSVFKEYEGRTPLDFKTMHYL